MAEKKHTIYGKILVAVWWEAWEETYVVCYYVFMIWRGICCLSLASGDDYMKPTEEALCIWALFLYV